MTYSTTRDTGNVKTELLAQGHRGGISGCSADCSRGATLRSNDVKKKSRNGKNARNHGLNQGIVSFRSNLFFPAAIVVRSGSLT